MRRLNLPGLLIVLSTISWAVPISGAARLAVRTPHSRAKSSIVAPWPVQFREEQDRGLLVRAWVNGNGPYTFAIDTGAGITVIAERLVSLIGLPIRTGSRIMIGGLTGTGVFSEGETLIDRIALGEPDNLLPARSVAVVAPYLPPDIDGILDPTEAYSPFGYSIDFPNHQIAVFDRNSGTLNGREPSGGGAIVPWVRDRESRRPFVRLGDGRIALIDTGSGFGLAVSEPDLTRARRGGGRVRDLGGGTIEARRVAPTIVSIGSLVLRGVPTDLLTGVEKGAPVILGREALRPFRITFDPVSRLIEIVPPPGNDD